MILSVENENMIRSVKAIYRTQTWTDKLLRVSKCEKFKWMASFMQIEHPNHSNKSLHRHAEAVDAMFMPTHDESVDRCVITKIPERIWFRRMLFALSSVPRSWWVGLWRERTCEDACVRGKWCLPPGKKCVLKLFQSNMNICYGSLI